MNKRQKYIFITFFCALVLLPVSMFLDLFLLGILSFILMIFSMIQTHRAATEEIKDDMNNFTQQIEKIAQDNNLNKNQVYNNWLRKQAMILDEEKSILAIIQSNNLKMIPFKDIISSEIIKDDVSITKTSRGSQIGGALVGAAIAGGLGALIGGLSGTKASHNEVKKLQLQITVDDLTNPVYTITFLNSDKPINTDDNNYLLIEEELIHWHKLLSVIINRNENNKALN